MTPPARHLDEVLTLYDRWGAEHYDEDLSQLAHAALAAPGGVVICLPDHKDVMKQVRQAWRRVENMALEDLDPARLHDDLDRMQSDLGAIHNALAQKYFHLHQQTDQ